MRAASLSVHALVAATATTTGWQDLVVEDLFDQSNALLGYPDYFDAVLKCKPAQARFEAFASEGGQKSEKSENTLEDRLVGSLREMAIKLSGTHEANVSEKTEEASFHGDTTKTIRQFRRMCMQGELWNEN